VALTTLIRFVNKTKSMGSFIESLKSLFYKRSFKMSSMWQNDDKHF